MKKNFKRISAMLVALFVMMSQIILPVFALPNTGDAGYCSVCHENGIVGAEMHVIDPTCGEDGFHIYACEYVDRSGANCPGTITVKVDPTGTHVGDGDVQTAVPSSCTEDGTVAYELCVECGCYLEPGTTTELVSIVDDADGHNYVPTVTGPDCVNGGYTTYVCSVCEDDYIDDEVDCLGHDFSIEHLEVPATCREEGTGYYKECSRCGAADREIATLPIVDHNGRIVDHLDPACTVDGYNVFQCQDPNGTCPYLQGVTEILTAPGHVIVEHEAVEAGCLNIGYDAYETCENCDYSTYDVNSEVPALGHTTVNKGYVAPTCTTTGMTDAVVCDRCDFVHHAGEEIAATGHTLTPTSAVAPTCTDDGNIAYTTCSVCGKNFAENAQGLPTDVALTTVVDPKLGHDYREWTQAPTCADVGYTIYTCERELVTGGECQHTYSEEIPATGHTFEFVPQVDPTCVDTGTKAHNKCTVADCQLLFAADAEPTADAVAVTLTSLEIAATGHTEVDVTAQNPTYDAAGNEAGTKCSVCGTPLVNAAVLPELDENVNFYYVIKGVNGAGKAVNSGYVTLEIYFDVEASQNDLDEYESVVLANIAGIDFGMTYDATVFELTEVEVAPGLFAKAQFTPYEIANTNGAFVITQSEDEGHNVFTGTNLFATLTFQVNADAPTATYAFTNSVLEVVSPYAVLDPADPEFEVVNTSADADVQIEVVALGDANGDTRFTSADTLIVSRYIAAADLETAYVAEYDMDKNGVIDFEDLDLIRKAIVGNEEYKTIIVDPNAVVEETPEVIG